MVAASVVLAVDEFLLEGAEERFELAALTPLYSNIAFRGWGRVHFVGFVWSAYDA